MENTRKLYVQPVNMSIYPEENNNPLSQFSDSIRRVLVVRHDIREARKEIRQEALANLLIELN